MHEDTVTSFAYNLKVAGTWPSVAPDSPGDYCQSIEDNASGMLSPTIEGEFVTYSSGGIGITNAESTATMRGKFSLRRHRAGTKEDVKGLVNSLVADLHRLIEEAYGKGGARRGGSLASKCLASP